MQVRETVEKGGNRLSKIDIHMYIYRRKGMRERERWGLWRCSKNVKLENCGWFRGFGDGCDGGERR